MNVDRIKRLVSEMRYNDIDAFIASYGPNLYYLSGFYEEDSERYLTLMIDKEGSIYLTLPKLYEAHALSEMNIDNSSYSDIEICVWEDHEGPHLCIKRMASTIKSKRLKNIAVDGRMRSSFLIYMIRYASDQITFMDGDPILYKLRMIKDSSEINKIVNSCRKLIKVFESFVSGINIKAGTREIDLANYLRAVALEHGYTLSFDPIVSSGPNTSYPHYRFGYRKISKGDVIIIDFGLDIDHYKSDFTRVLSVGPPSNKVVDLYYKVVDSQRVGLESINPGVKASEIDRAVRKNLNKWGLDQFFIHRTGHGLGLEIHEKPDISIGDHTILEKGMVFTVEPGIYLEDMFGLRVEDVVIVEDNGARIATRFPRDIVTI